MIGAIQTALSGLKAASLRADTNASNIAKAGTPAGADVDLAGEAISLDIAKISYKANAAVIKTSEDMQDSLLHIFDNKI